MARSIALAHGDEHILLPDADADPLPPPCTPPPPRLTRERMLAAIRDDPHVRLRPWQENPLSPPPASESPSSGYSASPEHQCVVRAWEVFRMDMRACAEIARDVRARGGGPYGWGELRYQHQKAIGRGDAYMHYEEGEESYPPHLRRYASPSGSGYWHPPLCCCGRPTCPAPERDW